MRRWHLSLAVLALLAAFPIASAAESGTVAGTLRGLSGEEVRVSHVRASGLTRFPRLRAGLYRLIVRDRYQNILHDEVIDLTADRTFQIALPPAGPEVMD